MFDGVSELCNVALPYHFFLCQKKILVIHFRVLYVVLFGGFFC